MKILIVRTDRIGDVLLSTPVFMAVREEYPEAYIAVMVRPYARDIVEGNPYVDEVIIYDKYGIHKNLLGTIKFSFFIKKKGFDLAIILHPTKRAHIITMLAGIPKRAGFDRKWGFLLTKRVPHTKQLGQQHELEYNMDLIRALDIKTPRSSLYFPVRREMKEWAEASLEKCGVKREDALVAVHPSASCPSKRWPSEYFARVADEVAARFGAKIIVVSASDGSEFTRNMQRAMNNKAIDFTGRTDIKQLGALLKKCALLISNDSGPVHIAVAVGTPVISIFGRKDPGLGPVRWRPLGKNDVTLHKNAGCQKCLAHNCNNDFKCLKAITVEEVLEAADKLLNGKIQDFVVKKLGGNHDTIDMLRP